MAKTSIFVEHKNQAYVGVANAVASEDVGTPLHAKRMTLAKKLAIGGGDLDWFLTTDFNAQGFDDDTTVADMETRIGGLLTNLIKLDFAG